MTEHQPPHSKSPEQYRRKLSRIILDLVERHGQHIREGKADREDSPFSLLFRLTAGNADAMEQLLGQEPLFFEQHPEVPPIILLDEAMKPLFPAEFFEDPTTFLERQPNIDRGAGFFPVAETHRALLDLRYDVTKVKAFDLGGPDGRALPVVSKRIDRKALSSVNRQREAFQAGIPTPQVYGEVLHGKNQYALFERVDGVTILDAVARTCRDPQEYYRMLQAPLFIDPRSWDYFFTSSEGQDVDFQATCKELAKKHQDAIAYNFFCSKLNIYIMDVVEGRRSHLRHANIFGGADVVNSYILRAARLLGISSVEEFFARYRSIPETIQSSWRDQWELDKDAIQQDAAIGIEAYNAEWRQMIDIHFFGFPLSQQREYLQRMTVEKGIPHKDFADRNIMIEWDFAENRPLIREGATEPRLLLIDWEEE